eukprot:jgi/Bigna1/89146/estExt_fgenesh1_pg.C_440092
MSTLPTLSDGAVDRINASKCEGLKAILQVLSVKEVSNGVRVVISDGKKYMPAFLDPKLKVDELGLKSNCVIETEDVIAKETQNRVYAILSKVELLDSEVEERIGSPKPAEKDGSGKAEYTTPSPASNKSTSRTENQGVQVNDVKRNLYHQPIATLNPYGSSNWTIKARVTMKGKLNSWMKNGRSGKVFNVHLLDAHGVEIRATFYNEAADKFFPVLEKGKIYTFSQGRLKLANKMYSTLSNNYEIVFNESSQIAPADDDGSEKIGQATHNYKKIVDIQNCAIRAVVNVIGVVTNYSEERTVRTKNNSELKCRKLTLADDSNAAIDIAVWGDRDQLTDEILSDKPIISVTGCRVSEWDGRSLSSSSASDIIVNPESKAAKRIREWNESGNRGNITTLSVKTQRSGSGPAKRICVDEIEEIARNSAEPVVLETRASVAYINANKDRPPFYNACVQCKKKVTGSPGSWMCDGCNKEYPTCNKRYLLRIALADQNGSQYVNCFNDQGVKIIGKTADEVGELMESDEKAFEAAFKKANFKEYKFVCKASRDEYQGQERVRCIVLRAEEVNAESESEYLLGQIDKYLEKEQKEDGN